MRPKLSLLVAAFALAACGGPKRSGPDGGPVDTSCGIDCVAQSRYGLLVNRCFEYTLGPAAHDPADLGALVMAPMTLETGIKVLPVQYTESGLIKMTDSFALTGGNLLLARRDWGPGSSVTYYDGSGNIAGVTWLNAGTTGSDVLTTPTSAHVLAAPDHIDATTYAVHTSAASGSALTVPAGGYDAGVALVTTESPDHGSDPQRVFVAGVGFISFSSFFSAAPTGTAQSFTLQKVRDIDPDGGSLNCGEGGP